MSNEAFRAGTSKAWKLQNRKPCVAQRLRGWAGAERFAPMFPAGNTGYGPRRTAASPLRASNRIVAGSGTTNAPKIPG